MKLGIMQPYFFPYIGYFQLMSSVDEFIMYDNIQFTKKGWINRNKILVNGKDTIITVPIKKDSDYLHVKQRFLAEIWSEEKKKLLNKIKGSYQKAPFFEMAYPIIEKSILFENDNLFDYLFNSIILLKDYLKIETSIIIASTVPIDHSLKGENKVLALCKERKADTYINPIGGVELYSLNVFKDDGIDLFFLKPDELAYKQLKNDFIPNLSIIDVIMFNSPDDIKEILNTNYTLV